MCLVFSDDKFNNIKQPCKVYPALLHEIPSLMYETGSPDEKPVAGGGGISCFNFTFNQLRVIEPQLHSR